MQFAIKNRFNGQIVFNGEFGNLKQCVEAAVEARENLSWAYLSGADLCGAMIDGAIIAPCNIGGPGHILYALTDEEATYIAEGRGKRRQRNDG